MDNLKPEHRRKNMQNIRSANTKIEILIRSELHKLGYRFRKNVNNLIGKPDIVFPKYKVVVFLDSCFWHLCPYHSNLPQTNKKYWLSKLYRNKARSREVNSVLRKKGWKVIRIWEHEINRDLGRVLIKIRQNLVKE